MLNKRLGIDFGTARSRVYLEGRGIVLDEPTVVAVRDRDGAILAVGGAARNLLGRAPEGVSALKPLSSGAICDYRVSEVFLTYLIRRTLGSFRVFKPEIMLSSSLGSTQVEKRALVDAALSAGAKNVYLIEQPLAAAIGAKIPFTEAGGAMVANLGAGCTETIVVSFGGIVASNSIKTAGLKIDQTITSYIKKKHAAVIGELTAEKIKMQIGAAIPDPGKNLPPREVSGQDLANGMPKVLTITIDEISSAISKNLQEIILCIKKVFELTPPELSSDIIDKGIVLTGGLAKLHNLNKLIMQVTGVACHVAENPDTCTAAGCGIAIENLETFEKLVVKK